MKRSEKIAEMLASLHASRGGKFRISMRSFLEGAETTEITEIREHLQKKKLVLLNFGDEYTVMDLKELREAGALSINVDALEATAKALGDDANAIAEYLKVKSEGRLN